MSREVQRTFAAHFGAPSWRWTRRRGSRSGRHTPFRRNRRSSRRNSAGVDYMGPSGSGVWTTPIVDTRRRALYFGTGNAFSEPATTADSIMAMNLDTGKILWWQQALANDVWHGGCAQTVPGRVAAQRPPGAGPGPGAGRGNQPPYPPENCVREDRAGLGLRGVSQSGDHARRAHRNHRFAETGRRTGARSG